MFKGVFDTKIYTRKGDGALCDAVGKKLKKYHPAIVANGEIDCAQAFMCACLEDLALYPEIRPFFKECAVNAGLVMSDICDGGRRITRELVSEIEKNIDMLNRGRLDKFCLFEERLPSKINLARCAARRAERSFWKFADMEGRWDINPELGPFLNRLSDYLFAAALYIQTTEKSRQL